MCSSKKQDGRLKLRPHSRQHNAFQCVSDKPDNTHCLDYNHTSRSPWTAKVPRHDRAKTNVRKTKACDIRSIPHKVRRIDVRMGFPCLKYKIFFYNSTPHTSLPTTDRVVMRSCAGFSVVDNDDVTIIGNAYDLPTRPSLTKVPNRFTELIYLSRCQVIRRTIHTSGVVTSLETNNAPTEPNCEGFQSKVSAIRIKTRCIRTLACDVQFLLLKACIEGNVHSMNVVDTCNRPFAFPVALLPRYFTRVYAIVHIKF